MKLSRGDTVMIISGKDKGEKGTIMRVLKENNRVIVSGLNMVTKHVKKTAQAEGKRIRFEASIHVSNVQVVDPKTGKPSRVGYKVDEKSGRKVRIAKKSGTVLSRVKMDTPATEKKKSEAPSKVKDSKEPAKKSPFWKKVGFGADATAEDAPKGETGPAKATIQTRSAGRGS